MKIELTEEQVFFIQKKLEDFGLSYTPLQDEILDHICCLTEEKMEAGITFEKAIQTIFEFFGKDELKKLQQQTISFTQKKSLRMKSILLASLVFLIIPSCVFIFSENLNSENKKRNSHTAVKVIQPPSPEEMMSIQDHHLSKNNHQIAEAVFTDVHDPPSIFPLDEKYEAHSGFGNRIHPVYKKKVFHRGIDFRAPTGTPVVATSDGEVVEAKKHKKGYGIHVVLQHDNEFKTMYAHLSKMEVKLGQKVKKGEVIGLVGNTGFSTAPHLHYEVIKNGKAVDPINYFNP